MRRRARRRGTTLIETSVACGLGTLLVYLVAMSWTGFDRGARMIVARAELVREADLILAHLSDRLRTGASPVFEDVDGRHLLASIGGDAYESTGGVLSCNGEPIAWHVDAILGEDNDRTITVVLTMPRVAEMPGKSLERRFSLLLARP